MPRSKRVVRIALAGNANVGKSTFFNQITGASQHVGNWPGKTVEKVEGFVKFGPYEIYILDLPGIYSLSAYSEEEVIAREYIAVEKPDVVIDIVDASALERNLYLTLQLLELEVPLVVGLNMVDVAAKKGFKIDLDKLSKLLGIPVIPMVAVSGRGVGKVLNKAIMVALGSEKVKPLRPAYGKEVEEAIERITELLSIRLPELCKSYPARWLAIKLLEEDEDVMEKVLKTPNGSEVLEVAKEIIRKLEEVHGESSQVVIASERYSLIGRIVGEVLRVERRSLMTLGDRLDLLTTHRVWGYLILSVVVASVFTSVFVVGDFLSGLIEEGVSAFIMSFVPKDIGFVKGLVDGFIAGLVLVIPYVIPFYLLLFFLEDSGYLPRAAFLLDSLMHWVGLHGKGFIPLLLGYGCNVPACLGCRIMETAREKTILGLMITMIPCAARTIIILSLVGSYLGVHVALAIYVLDLAVVFLVGRLANMAATGKPIGLIMEMPPYRLPSPKVILVETYVRVKDFIFIAFPLLILGSGFVEVLSDVGLSETISSILSPFLNIVLGLPGVTAIPLIFGILRKELTIAMLAEVAGTMDFSRVLTPRQMIVFSVFTVFYIPCIATIAAMFREYQLKKTVVISVTNITVATLISMLVNLALMSMGMA